MRTYARITCLHELPPPFLYHRHIANFFAAHLALTTVSGNTNSSIRKIRSRCHFVLSIGIDAIQNVCKEWCNAPVSNTPSLTLRGTGQSAMFQQPLLIKTLDHQEIHHCTTCPSNSRRHRVSGITKDQNTRHLHRKKTSRRWRQDARVYTGFITKIVALKARHSKALNTCCSTLIKKRSKAAATRQR